MKKRNLSYLTFVLLAFIILTPVVASSATVHYYTQVDEVEIHDAYYCDSDGDGYEDDIEALVEIHFENDTDQWTSIFRDKYDWIYVVFDNGTIYLVDDDAYLVIVEMILPSGFTYNYVFEDKTTEMVVNYHWYFYDHATEPGWYTLNVDVYGSLGTHKSDSVIFDPPGSEGGDEIG
ncbi:MAG: hypothetical protein ACFFD4_21160 [Candidatus Odinarchaeota archaeon]